MLPWFVFAGTALVVVTAGSRLATYGDALALRTGLSRAMLGAILVSGATSLPELVTDGSAVLQGSDGLAVGDIFGSSMANMAILATAMLVLPSARLLTRVAINQALVANLAIALTALATLGLLVDAGPAVAGVGWVPVAVFVSYIAGIWFVQRNRRSPLFATREVEAESLRESPTLVQASVGFFLAALAILFAAPFLAASAADIAEASGISDGFVGLTLLGITTSLPEMSVTFAGVRAGSYDLAVGNLLGSNAFNMSILLPLELLNGQRVLFSDVGPDVAIAGVTAIAMMSLVTLEILNRSERRFRYYEPGAMVILGVFAAGLALAYFADG